MPRDSKTFRVIDEIAAADGSSRKLHESSSPNDLMEQVDKEKQTISFVTIYYMYSYL